MRETVEEMSIRHKQKRAERHGRFNQPYPVQRDPEMQQYADELLAPTPFDTRYDMSGDRVKWRGQSGETHRDEVIAAADAGVQQAQDSAVDKMYIRCMTEPTLDMAPPPSFKHPSHRDFIEHATTHPSTDGVSEVKRMLGKPFNAIQLTADHRFTDGSGEFAAGTWLFEMSTTNGGKMWVAFLNETVQNEYRELSAETASDHVNARMANILGQLFPGATIAQMETAVADGKYIAIQQKDWSRVNDDAQRMKAAAEGLAKELEHTRPVVSALKQALRSEEQSGIDATNARTLLSVAVANGY